MKDAVVQAAIDLTAGAAGGAAYVFCGQPFDTVKVKMQTYPQLYRGATHCLRTVYQQEGMLGLYRGTWPALVANVSEMAVLFACYGFCRDVVRFITGASECVPLRCNTANVLMTRILVDLCCDLNNNVQEAMAGSLAAFFGSFVLTPTELVKCRLQAQHEMRTEGRHAPHKAWAVVQAVLREEGFQGLFTGLTSTIAREMPGYFFYFAGYQWTRSMLSTPVCTDNSLGHLSVITAGGVGGIMFWLAVYPIDSVKSRMQIRAAHCAGHGLPPPRHFFHFFSSILRTQGWQVLYSGLTPTLIRAFPSNGVLFWVFEMTRYFLNTKLQH
uniref:mitochondrial ornithine transporter 1-like n=1 Tax=Myxine glutinosa TaxID=7769 RepID=UPI00358F5B03